MVDKLASLEVTVLSAEGLSLSRRPINKNAFATVWTDSRNHASTTPDANGGSFPQWKERLYLPLPRWGGSIAVEVRCKTGLGVRFLGQASIPVSDFYGGVLPWDFLHFLSYRLRDGEGERNGIINLCIRAQAPPPPAPLPPPLSWVPGKANNAVAAGVAVGIPVPGHCIHRQ